VLIFASGPTFLFPLNAAADTNSAVAPRPNIILIMADDMGWSDIGAYGGEIPTPNIDRLAENGVRFSQFYNMARCYPTRASLMTGLHPHQTGIGGATNSPRGLIGDRGVFGYRGFLNRNSVTMAEVLGEAGYQTYLAGKWHLGYHTPDRWPLQRGFDRFYGSIAGATSYLKPQGGRGVMLDNTPLAPPEGEYYTTDAFTDHAIRFIEDGQHGAPFFLYLAYTAPHWPLHAKEEDIQKFVGKYRDIGWDRLREQRLQRQVELGVLQEEQALSPRDAGARPWDDLSDEQKEQLDYRMAVYAAQVYSMDYNIGRVIDLLERRGDLDNTLIMFLSDNGGCAEPYDDLGGKDFSMINNENYSGAVSYGQGWANASNTPFRRFKVWVNEGGISTPLVVHWPKGQGTRAGSWVRSPAWVPDLMPTVLELAGATYPTRYNGYDITPYAGQSIVPALQNGSLDRRRWMFWEHMNHKAVRQENWKAVLEREPHGPGQWQLFDMSNDRNEMHDLAKKYPDQLTRMVSDWEEWAQNAHVYPKPPKLEVPNAPVPGWPAYREQ
jgi:arylsulfatase